MALGPRPPLLHQDRLVLLYGLSFDTAMSALEVLLAGSRLAGLTINELNPHHGGPDGSILA